MKRWNRILSILMALALVCTTFGSDLASTISYAVESDEELPKLDNDNIKTVESEPVQEEQEQPSQEDNSDGYTEETPAEEGTPADEGAPADPSASEDAPPTENSEEAGEAADAAVTGSTISEDQSGEETTDEAIEGVSLDEASDAASLASSEDAAAEESSEDDASKEKSVEEKKEKKEKLPEVSYEITASNGVTVDITAPEGAFPEGTEIKVTPVNNNSIIETVKDAADIEADSVLAVDISFIHDGEEIEPKKAIKVKLSSSIISDADSMQVVHVDDNQKAEVIDNVSVSGDTASFQASDFSVYAICTGKEDDVEVYRFTYYFKDLNDSNEPVDYMFYNKDGEQVNNQIIKNGEALTGFESPYHEGREFKGWFIYADGAYGDAVEFGQAIEVTEDKTFEVRAKYTNAFTVAYTDENGAIVHEDLVDTEDGSYEVNNPYVPKDMNTNFFGWTPVDSTGNISTEATLEKPNVYPNNTNVTITGNVKLMPYTEEGHWLTFDENGKGATYVGPQFVETNKKPIEPDSTKMLRQGYKFDGWYESKTPSETDEPFDFDKILEKDTIVYAKWTPNEEAGYTVIIWLESLRGNDGVTDNDALKYDFKESVRLKGPSNTTVDKISRDGTYTVKINGVSKKYPGFQLYKFDDDVEIAPEGTSIVNVYFTRVTYNVKFRFGFKDRSGQYKVYKTENNSENANGFNPDLVEGSQYDEATRYYYITVSAKYGHDISSEWPMPDRFTALENVIGKKFISWILMDGATAKQAGQDGKNTVKGLIGVMDEKILGKLESPDGNYLDARWDSMTYSYTYYLYEECLLGEEHDPDAVKFNNKYYKQFEVLEDVRSNASYTGQHAPTYSGLVWKGDVTGENFSNWARYDTSEDTTDPRTRITYRKVYFYYLRTEAKIVYRNGQYKNGDGNIIENLRPTSHPILKEENAIFGETLSAYDKGGAKYYEPEAEKGFLFGGWYADSECNTEFTFGDMTMGEGSIEVYAKWIQKQYRVFLHPGIPAGETPQWGENSSTSFRGDYGEKVEGIDSLRRTGYELIGWYSDPDFNKPFNTAAYVLNDSTVTTPYDRENEETERDAWGNVSESGVHKDADRYWIDRKLELYAKWRSKLVGAIGIEVEYYLDDENNFKDSTVYADNTKVLAFTNTFEAPENTHFVYWIVQHWDGSAYVDSEINVKEGSNFTVYKKDAKLVEGGTVENPENTYTVRLIPYFEDNDKSDIDLTKIVYDGNGGVTSLRSDSAVNREVDSDKKTVTYSKIQLNSEITISQQGFSREGYDFLGWANEVQVSDDDPDPESKVDFAVGDKVGADNLDPKTNTLYAVWKRMLTVDVVITGNSSIEGNIYNGDADAPYIVTGYEWIATDSSGNTITVEDETVFVDLKAEAETKITLSGVDAGTYEMDIKEADFDVTSEKYIINSVRVIPGKLVVDKLPIVINITGHKSPEEGETNVYTGDEYTVEGYDVTYDAAQSAKQKDDGTVEALTLTAAEVEALHGTNNIIFTGTDKLTKIAPDTYKMGLAEDQFSSSNTKNLDVTFKVVDGELVIVPRGDDEKYILYITAGNASRVYNGYDQTVTLIPTVTPEVDQEPETEEPLIIGRLIAPLRDLFTVVASAEDGEAPFEIGGHEFVAKNILVSATGKDVADYNFSFAKKVEIYQGDDKVTENFKIISRLGHLSITPAPLQVTTESNSKVFDGDPLTAGGSLTGLVAGEIANLIITGSQTDVGSSDNTYRIEWDTAKSTNYSITESIGRLTVTGGGGGGGTPPGGGTPTPPTTTTIVDTPTPTAPTPVPVPDAAAVLGERRELQGGNGQAVLGARRSRTEDESNFGARIMLILISAIGAVLLTFIGRKKEKSTEQ